MQELSKFCIIKHIPSKGIETTVIDGKHIFQFKETPAGQSVPEEDDFFENTFYTNDPGYIEKTKNMLDDIWKNANEPSQVSLESILDEVKPMFVPFAGKGSYAKKVGLPNIINETSPGTITEKEILSKILNDKNKTERSSNVIDKMYGSIGLAIIHSPNYLNLPDIMLLVHKIEKQSTLGEEDAIVIFQWLETQKGRAYAPVALIGDNPKAQTFWKTLFKGAPAEQNVQLVKKDEIEVRVHGNTLFAGWTVPIPLYPKNHTLPPACLLIEGYGEVKSTALTIALPNGYKSVREQNYFDAFVTFFHPSSTYSGPGTDGYFIRDSVQTMYLPQATPENK